MSRLSPVVLVALAAAIGTCACGSTAGTQPSTTILPVTGAWTGAYRITACQAGIQACSFLRSSYSMRLVLQQAGHAVTGTFAGEIPAVVASTAIAVTGSFDSSSTLRVQGSQPFLYGGFDPRSSQAGIDIGNWTTVMNEAGDSMTGTFHLTVQWRGTNAYPDTWNIDTEIIALTR